MRSQRGPLAAIVIRSGTGWSILVPLAVQRGIRPACEHLASPIERARSACRSRGSRPPREEPRGQSTGSIAVSTALPGRNARWASGTSSTAAQVRGAVVDVAGGLYASGMVPGDACAVRARRSARPAGVALRHPRGGGRASVKIRAPVPVDPRYMARVSTRPLPYRPRRASHRGQAATRRPLAGSPRPVGAQRSPRLNRRA